MCIDYSISEYEKYIFLYRYLIVVHSIACFIVLKQYFTVGFRVKKQFTHCTVKHGLWAALLVPVSQIPASIFRYLSAVDNKGLMIDPLQQYLDFFWSPMMTMFIVWLFQVYVSKFCFYMDRIVKNEEIVAFIMPHRLFLAFSCGTLTASVLTLYSPCYDIIFRILIFVALALTSLEAITSKFILRGKTSLISYTLFWFFGTWAYFVWRLV